MDSSSKLHVAMMVGLTVASILALVTIDLAAFWYIHAAPITPEAGAVLGVAIQGVNALPALAFGYWFGAAFNKNNN